MERAAAHALLDKVLDGGHTGNISAMLSTMHVYAEAVEDRKQRCKLEKNIENLKISILQQRLNHG